jgi:CheY-like chemotaxis protein
VRVLAFEDTYDIEAILVAGGVNVEAMTLLQRWNSSDALGHIQSFKPDVLLLDHFMPPMNGLEVLKQLLASETKRPATIIAMSSEPSMNEAMLQAGADRGVIKFDIATLSMWD